MGTKELTEIIGRVMTWPREDQEKVARFVNEFEEWSVQDRTETE